MRNKLIYQFINLSCVLLLVFNTFTGSAIANQSTTVNNQAPEIKNDITEFNHYGDNNNQIIINPESDNALNVAAGVVVGAVTGGVSSVAVVSAVGSVAGLSAAGISSGLATMGAIVGGGMAAGLVVSVALPVVAAAGGGFAVYQVGKSFFPNNENKKNAQEKAQITINNN